MLIIVYLLLQETSSLTTTNNNKQLQQEPDVSEQSESPEPCDGWFLFIATVEPA